MTSDKKKTSPPTSGNGGSVPHTKRPGRTINLEAEDVTVVDVPETEKSASARKKAKPAPNAKADAPKDDDTGPESKTSSAAAGRRSKPFEIKRFATHLAAGFIGGLIGVIGSGFVYDPPPVTVEPAKPYNDAQLIERLNKVESNLAKLPRDDAPLVKRLSTIETELAALPKGNPVSEIRETTGKIERRVTALENKPPAVDPDIKDFSTRLGKLEDTLKTLQEAGSQEGASGIAQSAMLTGRIDDVSTQFEERIGEFKSDMAALKKALETQRAERVQASSKTTGDLTDRLGLFEKNIAALKEKIAGAASLSTPLLATSDGSAAVALAFASVRRAAERGHPYADQLTALEEIAPDGLDLTELEANAVTGIATEAELLSALPKVLKAARAAIVKTEDETFLDRVVTNARSVVRIRRIGPQEGDSPEQVLSRMEAQIKLLNLDGILLEAEGLKGAVLDAVKPWTDKAKARRASEELLDRLGQRLLGALQSQSEEKR